MAKGSRHRHAVAGRLFRVFSLFRKVNRDIRTKEDIRKYIKAR